MKKWFAAVFLYIYAVTAFTAPAEAAVRSIVKAGFYTYEGFQETNEFGKHSGLSYELYSEMEQFMSSKFEYINNSYDTCEAMLSNGDIDVINGVIKTPEREKKYDFSILPTGAVQPCVYAPANAAEILPEDFAALSGKKVGLVSDNIINRELEQFANSRGIVCEKVYFSDETALERAALNGDTDFIFTEHTENNSAFKSVARLEPVPVYFAVKKGNPLMRKIDSAMKTLSEVYPEFMNGISLRAVSSSMPLPYFTGEELEYISSNPEITVMLSADNAPIEYYDSELCAYCGIVTDIFKEIEEYSGLKFSYELSDSESDMHMTMYNTDRNILCAFYKDYDWADNNNIYTTSPFLSSNHVFITRKNHTSGKNDKAALVKNSYMFYKYISENPGTDITPCSSARECVDAVNSGKADFAVLDSRAAGYYLSMFRYSRLNISRMDDRRENLAIGMSRNTNPLLMSILNKSLLNISERRMNEIIAGNTIPKEKVTLRTFVYANPVGSVAIILFAALTAIFAVTARLKRAKQVNALIRENNDRLLLTNKRFTVAIQHMTCSVFEYELDTMTLFVIDKQTGRHIRIVDNTPAGISEYTGRAVYPDIINIFDELFIHFSDGEDTVREVIEGIGSNKSKCWGEFTAAAVYNSSGRAVRAICVINDVTGAVNEKQLLQEKFNVTLKSTYEDVYEIDLDKKSVSSVFSKENMCFTDTDLTAFIDKFETDFVEKSYAEKFRHYLNYDRILKLSQSRDASSDENSIYFECNLWTRSTNSYRYKSFTVVREDLYKNLILMFIQDIDDRTKERQLLINKSLKDSLTDLYSKAAFYELCRKFTSENPKLSFSVIFMDMDNFKELNDTLGHMRGDEAICAAAKKLRLVFSNNDIIARFGGDEFCVLIKNMPLGRLKDKLTFLIQKMNQIYSEGKQSVHVTASVGAVISDGRTDFDTLMKRADEALYKAKSLGKNRFVFYGGEEWHEQKGTD